MRFSFYAALAASASAVHLMDDPDAYADYLWAQQAAGEISHEEMIELAQEYAEDHFGVPSELAETQPDPKNLGGTGSNAGLSTRQNAMLKLASEKGAKFKEGSFA